MARTSLSDSQEVMPLRERRKRETTQLIGNITLDLFEENGVEATTVDQIAERAGISSRTFFRYFSTKEDAALLLHEEFQTVLYRNLDERDPSQPLIRSVVQSYHEVVKLFGDGSTPLGKSTLRLRTLLLSNPSLMRQENERSAQEDRRLQRYIAEALEIDAATDPRPGLIVDLAGTVTRTAISVWAAHIERSARPDCGNIFDMVLNEMLDQVESLKR